MEKEHLTYDQISDVLKRFYPGFCGLSAMSVRRFSNHRGIKKTSRLNDVDLDVV